MRAWCGMRYRAALIDPIAAPAQTCTPMHSIVPSLLALALLVACGPGRKDADPAAAAQGGRPAASAAAADRPPLLLSAEDLRAVQLGDVGGGPLITGSLQPERRADLRAEVSAVVLQVLKDNGEPVRKGELLVRLDDTAIRDSVTSAEASARAAAQALEQAERQLKRQKALQAQGMVSLQALDDAEVRRNAAQSESVAASARLVTARQQLRRTEVRAPFDGVVSERKTSAGDTAALGKELLKVMDPRSMRFEGLVSAEHLAEIKRGQTVHFRVNGDARGDYVGTVQRIDATANATTRQIEVRVAFADGPRAPRLAGLFAEGRITTGGAKVLVLPEGSVVRQGDATHVWRVAGGTLSKVAVRLAARDPRRGEFPVLAGLTAGDRVLRNPGGALVEGQRVEFAAAAAMATASSPSPQPQPSPLAK